MKILKQSARLLFTEETKRGCPKGQPLSTPTGGTAGSDGTRTPAGAANAAGANGTTAGTKSAADMDLLYADPSLTNAAECSTEGVLMIGDSIMLDSSPALKEQLPDCYIDAVQSDIDHAISRVEALLRRLRASM